MSPQQLLRETQRAAGDPRLTNWHDTLISAGKEMAQLVEVGSRLPACHLCAAHTYSLIRVTPGSQLRKAKTQDT